ALSVHAWRQPSIPAPSPPWERRSLGLRLKWSGTQPRMAASIKGAGIHRRCSSVLQVFATMWAMSHELGNCDANHGGGGRMDHHTVADLAITRGKVRPRDHRWLSYSSVPIFRWSRHRALRHMSR